MSVTRTGAPASARAASSPPKPPPMITTWACTLENAIVHAMHSLLTSCRARRCSEFRDDPVLGGPASVVETACPLDCPDACSLSVTVQHGKIVDIDGSHKNPVTDGYICAKVRKFGDRVYGPDRLLYPAVRKGRKGEGRFERVAWDEALELVAERMRAREGRVRAARRSCPYSYGGSNGLLTQDNLDATFWRRLRDVAAGTHAVRGADRRRQHGALRQDAVGHLPGLSRGAR